MLECWLTSIAACSGSLIDTKHTVNASDKTREQNGSNQVAKLLLFSTRGSNTALTNKDKRQSWHFKAIMGGGGRVPKYGMKIYL